MNLLQVTLISLLGYLTYIHTPFLGGGLSAGTASADRWSPRCLSV